MMQTKNSGLVWQPFQWVAVALIFGTMSTALISPLLPLYEAAWHISHSAITIIFVAYMFGVLAALLFLGKFADYVGPLRTLKYASLLMAVCLLASAAASNMYMLMAARFFIGVASGLIATSAMLSMAQVEPLHFGKKKAPEITSIVSIIGFGLGPFVGGILGQFVWHPLQLTFIITAIPAFISVYALFKLHSLPVNRTGPLSFAPQFILPHVSQRLAFWVASFAVFTAFALFSFMASLAPSFLSKILPWHGPAVSGIAVSSAFLFSTISQFFMRRFAPEKILTVGFITMWMGILSLGCALLFDFSPLFFIAVGLIGWGHGSSFMGGIATVNILAKGGSKTGMLCSFFTIGYLGAIIPVIAVGWLSDVIGIRAAVITFSFSFVVFISGLMMVKRKVPMH